MDYIRVESISSLYPMAWHDSRCVTIRLEADIAMVRIHQDAQGYAHRCQPGLPHSRGCWFAVDAARLGLVELLGTAARTPPTVKREQECFLLPKGSLLNVGQPSATFEEDVAHAGGNLQAELLADSPPSRYLGHHLPPKLR